MTKEEAISTLSEIRAEYNCYELRDERIRYHAVSMGIDALKERKHGKWIKDEDGCLCCSLCGNPCEINCINGKYIRSPFCSECGALMKECEVTDDV